MDAYDADVLIYAAADHPLGRPVARLLGSGAPAVGSVLLLPEVLAKPLRERGEDDAEVLALAGLLALLDLRPLDRATAELATVLARTYRLRAADAAHLATAVAAGADRFVTNNSRDFGRDIVEVDVAYPADLPS